MRLTGLLCFVLAAGLVACGGNPREEVAEDAIDIMNDLASALEGIEDKSDIAAVKAKLDELKTRGQELEKRMNAIKDPASMEEAEQWAKEMEKYAEPMKKATERVVNALKKFTGDPELQNAVNELMQSIR